MGVYDSVWFICPKCGHEFENQTKAWDCIMASFESTESIPYSFALAVADAHAKCWECGAEFRIRADMPTPPPEVMLRLEEESPE